MTTTLHIEHAVTDLATWRTAFDRFGELRAAAGVTTHRILRPIDDDHYVVVQLDFDESTRATDFLQVLRTQIWSNPSASPALEGAPRATLLEPI